MTSEPDEVGKSEGPPGEEAENQEGGDLGGIDSLDGFEGDAPVAPVGEPIPFGAAPAPGQQTGCQTALKAGVPALIAIPAMVGFVVAMFLMNASQAFCDIPDECSNEAGWRVFPWVMMVIYLGGTLACIFLAKSRRWWIAAWVTAVALTSFLWGPLLGGTIDHFLLK
ncbi:MAG: hypothetical protein LBH68_08070 [Bifidobacteriaceae bacterium]|jgi:hypothetical protein|nr:hypothetical protein [Bifidobacteriaceae bacterium]